MVVDSTESVGFNEEETPRCLECAYCLIGLTEKRCPECGRPFDLADASTFTLRPPLVLWRLWLPGVGLAILSGIIVFVVSLAGGGGVGWGASLAAPTCIGVILGYRSRVRPIARILLVLTVLTAVVFCLFSLSFVGLFCAGIFVVVAAIPCILGAFLGSGLRWRLKKSNFDQRSYLPVFLAIMIPIALATAERIVDAPPDRMAVQTSRIINSPVRDAWNAICYYEQLSDDRPLLFRLGAPQPIGTRGRLTVPGDVQVCLYTKGRVIKRLREVVNQERLVFDVIEQNIGFERSAVLRAGSFLFETIDSDTTKVTLRTEYDAPLKPRFCWEAAERITLRTLHNYILDGIERNAHRIEGESHSGASLAYDEG